MNIDPGAALVGAGGLLVGVVLGRPQWWLARRQMREKKAADERARKLDELRELLGAGVKAITGTDDVSQIADPSPDNPSLRDALSQALEETAELAAAVALLRHALELHLATTHGGDVPDWVMRAIAEPMQRGRRY